MHTKRKNRILTKAEIEQYFLTDEIKEKTREAFLKTYFYDYDPEFLASEAGQDDIDANVFIRYTNSLQHVVPWMMKQLDLKGTKIVEIGCGPGSASAVFANFCKKLTGYDIKKQCIDSAKERAKIMKQKNVNYHLVQPENLIVNIKKNHKKGSIDVVLFFAVIEHMTIEERIEALRTAWELLNEGGILVVVETPNRFIYVDDHTTGLPFFHLLPLELATLYADRTKRTTFTESLQKSYEDSFQDAYVNLTRWGLGASYHEFELALGKVYSENLVAEGFEEEILPWFGINVEEELLRLYFQKKKLEVPLAYSRSVLNLILQKAKDPKDLVKSGINPPNYTIITPQDLAPEQILAETNNPSP